jgi:hypothetical protein
MTFQVTRTKKGDTYTYSTKKADGILKCLEGQYRLNPDGTGTLSVLFDRDMGLKFSSIENGVWKNDIGDADVAYPIQVNLSIGTDTIPAKALHAYFASEHGKELAKGFAGEISFSTFPSTVRISEGNPKPTDWEAFCEILPLDTKSITLPNVPTGGNYGNSKSQTEKERIEDRCQAIIDLGIAGTPIQKSYEAYLSQNPKATISDFLALILS